MMDFRHCAYNVRTGEILNSERGSTLKRAVQMTNKLNKHFYGKAFAEWRFCHDYGKKWNVYGLPSQ